MLLIPGTSVRPAFARHPLVWAAAAIAAVLSIQCLVMPEVFAKAQLTAAGVLFFVLCVALGGALHTREGERSFTKIAVCVLVAALGSSVFAGIQLIGLDRGLPFVVPRSDNRLYGNVGQANHFADLLWLGMIAATYLAAPRRLGLLAAAPIVLTLQVFSVFSGSRTAWLYALVLVALGLAAWLRRTGAATRRLATGFLILGACYGAVVVAVEASGVLDRYGVTSAERRIGNANVDESTSQRLWFWRTGLEAAAQHPLLGVGVGRLAGFARERAMTASDAPSRAADAHAHNVIIQLAAELGVPLAVLVAVALLMWLVAAVRRPWRDPGNVAALAMAGVILIHANLEHPLAYLYFLGTFGLLVGHVPIREEARVTALNGSQALRLASFAMLAFAGYAYLQFDPVDKATRIVASQVRLGQPPHSSNELAARLAGVWRGSPYRDYAETLALMAAVPTPATAADLADRCEQNVQIGPTPYLLARCATDLQVAGRPERASNFADSLCRIYPGSDRVLAQSIAFVKTVSPAAGDIQGSCVKRVE